jgi:hypothetical protein
MYRSYDRLHVEIYTSQMMMAGMRFRRFPITQLCFNSCSVFHSNYPLHVSVIRPCSCANIYNKNIMTSVRFRGFPLTQLCFNNCSISYSNSPLHDSVVRPSSCAISYITKCPEWRGFRSFRLT